jgi:hypothetical protein
VTRLEGAALQVTDVRRDCVLWLSEAEARAGGRGVCAARGEAGGPPFRCPAIATAIRLLQVHRSPSPLRGTCALVVSHAADVDACGGGRLLTGIAGAELYGPTQRPAWVAAGGACKDNGGVLSRRWCVLRGAQGRRASGGPSSGGVAVATGSTPSSVREEKEIDSPLGFQSLRFFPPLCGACGAVTRVWLRRRGR